jgi:hypothetical protein
MLLEVFKNAENDIVQIPTHYQILYAASMVSYPTCLKVSKAPSQLSTNNPGWWCMTVIQA